ncbi:hypothetical protein CHLRE_01g061807v5 [Chlamydomonas reinhardtii]|uniref:Bax inhibitor 1 n=1 Tax=Chlamydomonas reinhardtii TaxID=3055 RepID=A8JCT0_CHLRE|nr:uncharacterized protein CHLRE_01g061807v5 [Chlamydomonas reinhardtii]PNW89070.1 hypothetical protein CHLRE_01g061807v5 [Chlamydomonas reinhardtii]|eukprot:XP_001700193.1 predicted protein [Chlamydomonas reinhardtii]
MDAVERLGSMFTGRRFDGVNLNTFLKFTQLDPGVQAYLQRVYLTLSVAVAISALGCFLDIQYSIGGWLTGLMGFGCMLGLAFTSATPQTLNKRYALLGGFAFCQGAALGPLVGLAAAVSPGLVLSAFLGTAAVFACFSLASLLSPRRSFLYLGGYLSSAVMALAALRLGAWLAGGRAGFSLELYGGLLVFCGYVLLDTQIMVEKAAAGYRDHVKAALDLLVDLLAIFVRVLLHLLKSQAAKEERRRRDERNKQRRD